LLFIFNFYPSKYKAIIEDTNKTLQSQWQMESTEKLL